VLFSLVALLLSAVEFWEDELLFDELLLLELLLLVD